MLGTGRRLAASERRRARRRDKGPPRALAAALNPTLLAASTLMLLLPNPKRLMLGYLLGALLTSITLGLIIVFSLESSDAVSTIENTLSPAATMAIGVIWQQALTKGSARTTFVVGALLTLPGASYLAGLSRIDKLNYSTVATVLLVIAFNLVMLALLEVPLLGFAVAPRWTIGAIDQAKAWTGRHGQRFAVTMLVLLGGLLVIKGLIELLA